MSLSCHLSNSLPLKLIQHAKGTYGKIYRADDTNFVYKEIPLRGKDTKDPKDMELEVREVFLEIFIQTILSSDTTFGEHICKVFGLFRSEDNRKLYVLMEYIPNTFSNQFKQQTFRKMKHFLPFLLKLSQIMAYFHETYAFYHRDFHPNNIMFTSDNEIRIIDFGMSCLQFDDVEYSLIDENVVKQPDTITKLVPKISAYTCFSYDFLIFLACFYDTYAKEYCTDELRVFVHSMMVTSYGINLYDLWKEKLQYGSIEKPLFYQMYYWKIQTDWHPSLREALFATKELFPRGIWETCQKKVFDTNRNAEYTQTEPAKA